MSDETSPSVSASSEAETDGTPVTPPGVAPSTASSPSGSVPTPPPLGPDDRPARAPEPDEPDDESLVAFLKELPVLLLIAFVLAFLLRTFVVQVFYIPSGSMEDTLQLNDRMIVEKVTYQFREPERGEIIVFEGETTGFADNQRSLPAKVINRVGQFLGIVPADARDFVKRVVGLPGDTVSIDDRGTVSVNGTELDEPYKLNQERAYGPVTVPDGKLFLLGDNRGNSSDSRSPTLGFVDLDQIIGRAVLVIWPPDRFGVLDKPDYGPVAPPGGEAVDLARRHGVAAWRWELPAA